MKKIWLALMVALCLFSCKKELMPVKLPADDSTLTSSSLPASSFTPITVSVNQDKEGYRIPAIFEGLSYETGILTNNPDFLNENNAVLIQLIKNLGPGMLRIGGNSSDLIGWTGKPRNDNTGRDSLTTSDIDRLTAFSKAIGWPVLFGLNLGQYNAKAAASEAFYVGNSLQSNLYALQSGNEPDVFNLHPRSSHYSYADYQQQWESYFAAVKKLMPAVRFAGPDVIPFDNDWINSFADAEHNNIRMLDGHFYNCGPASNPSITYNNILKLNPRLEDYLIDLSKISTQYHLPYRISETNSVFGQGKPGVSDAFASALWALDFMWTVAENKGQGINFHGGDLHFVYSPINGQTGAFGPRPEYYAMLAFRQASAGGAIIPAEIQDPRAYNNCSAYACAKADSSYAITLINKEVSKNFAFTIQLTRTASTIQIARLKAPTITSTSGVTFAGSAVNADGSYNAAKSKIYTVNKKSFVIKVPAGSAAVVMVR